MPTLAIERLFKIAQYRNVFIEGWPTLRKNREGWGSHSVVVSAEGWASPPWKSGPSEPALSLPKGPRKPSEISQGFSPGGRSSSSDCIFPQAGSVVSRKFAA